MDEWFAWAHNNLGVETPHELQERGVNVFFAPNISSDIKLVNLANGQVVTFHDGEKRPDRGYFADFESLERYCHKHDIPFIETSGIVSTQPADREAPRR
jgi:hypothetical protein